MSREPKEGELWGAFSCTGWARHGLFRIVSRGGYLRAEDTYWTSYEDGFAVEDAPDDFEFVFDLNNSKLVDREEWSKYAEDDRTYIPIGGTAEKWLIHKDALFDPANWRSAVEGEIQSVQGKIETLQYRVERLRAELDTVPVSLEKS